jgi:CRP-like cAMP-binding protein
MTYLLRNVELFASFSDLERAELVHFMHERRFSAGDTVFTRGEHGNTMLIVVQGALSAVIPGRGNRHQEVARMPAGAYVGEMFCIDPAPRPVTVVASEETIALELSRDDLIRMRQEVPRTAAALVSVVFKEVLKRLRTIDDRLERELSGSASASYEEDPPPPSSARELPDSWEACFTRLRGSA